jgi:hypothetical protein
MIHWRNEPVQSLASLTPQVTDRRQPVELPAGFDSFSLGFQDRLLAKNDPLPSGHTSRRWGIAVKRSD